MIHSAYSILIYPNSMSPALSRSRDYNEVTTESLMPPPFKEHPKHMSVSTSYYFVPSAPPPVMSETYSLDIFSGLASGFSLPEDESPRSSYPPAQVRREDSPPMSTRARIEKVHDLNSIFDVVIKELHPEKLSDDKRLEHTIKSGERAAVQVALDILPKD